MIIVSLFLQPHHIKYSFIQSCWVSQIFKCVIKNWTFINCCCLLLIYQKLRVCSLRPFKVSPRNRIYLGCIFIRSIISLSFFFWSNVEEETADLIEQNRWLMFIGENGFSLVFLQPAICLGMRWWFDGLS